MALFDNTKRFFLSLVLYMFFLGKIISQSCPGSLLLDANNSVVDLPVTNQYYTGNNQGYTWECWFKLNQPFGTDMRPLISSVDGVLFEDQWLGFGWQGGWFNEPVTKLVFKVDGPNSTFPTGPNCSYQPSGGFILGNWYHAAGVMDYGNQISKLYVNGVLVDSKPITTPPITRVIPTQLGLNFGGTNMPLYGNMDEVRIWTRPLSATEIASNYDKCLSGSEPNLFLYYRCNQPSGSNVPDASPNNNIGLFATSPNWSTQQPVITGTACASAASTFSANISSTCQGTNTSIASVTVSTNVANPVFSYSWTNSSGVVINQTNSITSFTNSVSSLANGVYSLTVQMVTPCGITTSITQTLTVNCTNQSNPPLCSGNLGNAVFMEDFGSGTSLYGPALPAGTTNYIYQTGNPANGTYVISSNSNPSGVNLGYVSDGDHTGNPNGYMMVVNSDYPASEVYRKHVTGLCQNTTYVFSAYLSNNNTPTTPNNVCPGYVYANVKFQIEYPLGTIQNSVTTGNLPLGLSNTALNWQQYGYVFTTFPGQTSVDIVLKNNAPGGCGNDYVVDDISLSPCGPGVSLSIVPNQTVFCVGDAVSLQSNYTTGSYVNPQYQWQFSNNGGGTWTNIVGATSQNYSITSVSQSQSGMYQLLVAENGNINSAACSIVAGPISFTVSSGISVNSSTTICSGNSATITASGSNSYNWSNGATTNSVVVSPIVTTVYSVIGTVGSCTSQATSTVNVIPSSTISVSGNTLICAGQTTSLTASGAPSYLWNTGSTLSSITLNPGLTTTYTASATGSLCVVPAQITVSVVAIPNVSAGTNTVFCLGQTGVILTAMGANTYTWSNASSLSSSSSITVSATPSITTNYTLIGMNSLCTNTAVVTVSVNASPTITSISYLNTSCGLNNGEITINSLPTNNTYSWSSGVTSTTNTASSLAAGTYTVNLANGACNTSTVVTILNSQPLIILSNSITPSDCGVSNGNISVVTNYTNSVFSWTPSAINSPSISNLPAGSYSLSIVSGACSTSTVFNVLQLNGPTALLYNLSDAICESLNGSIVVIGAANGVAPYQYAFNNTGYSSVNTFSNLAQGVYTITVKDAHGCVYSKTIAVGKSTVTSTINLTTNYPSCDNTDGSFIINSITGGTSPFLLSFNGLQFSLDSIFEDLGPGNYPLIIKDSNQCETTIILEMPIDKNDYTLYIPNTFTPNKDIVNDTWFVKGTCINAFNCLIFNRWGEKIIELKDINEYWDGTYKGKNVPDGVYVYLIEAETNNGTIYKNGHITLFR